MIPLRTDEIRQAIRGRWLCSCPDLTISSVSIDTRTAAGGELSPARKETIMSFYPITWTPSFPRFFPNPEALRVELKALEQHYLTLTYDIHELEEALRTGGVPTPISFALPNGRCATLRPALYHRWHEILEALENCEDRLDSPKKIRAFVQSVAGVKRVPLGLRGNYTKADVVEHLRLTGYRNLLTGAKECRRHLRETMTQLRNLILQAEVDQLRADSPPYLWH